MDFKNIWSNNELISNVNVTVTNNSKGTTYHYKLSEEQDSLYAKLLNNNRSYYVSQILILFFGIFIWYNMSFFVIV